LNALVLIAWQAFELALKRSVNFLMTLQLETFYEQQLSIIVNLHRFLDLIMQLHSYEFRHQLANAIIKSFE